MSAILTWCRPPWPPYRGLLDLIWAPLSSSQGPLTLRGADWPDMGLSDLMWAPLTSLCGAEWPNVSLLMQAHLIWCTPPWADVGPLGLRQPLFELMWPCCPVMGPCDLIQTPSTSYCCLFGLTLASWPPWTLPGPLVPRKGDPLNRPNLDPLDFLNTAPLNHANMGLFVTT